MQVITRSVIVDAPVDVVYEISNQVDRWPEMIPEYLKAEILRREGRKIWFRLTNADNMSWVSWRMLYPPLISYAERHEPLAPFTFNHLTWVYQPLPGNRSQMTWDMCFELVEDKRAEEPQWRQRMAEHTAANQEALREYIESVARKPESPAWQPVPVTGDAASATDNSVSPAGDSASRTENRRTENRRTGNTKQRARDEYR